MKRPGKTERAGFLASQQEGSNLVADARVRGSRSALLRTCRGARDRLGPARAILDDPGHDVLKIRERSADACSGQNRKKPIDASLERAAARRVQDSRERLEDHIFL